MTVWPSGWEVTLYVTTLTKPHNVQSEELAAGINAINNQIENQRRSQHFYTAHASRTFIIGSCATYLHTAKYWRWRRINQCGACSAQCPDQQCTSVGRMMQWHTGLNVQSAHTPAVMKNQTNVPPASNKIKTDTRMLSNRTPQTSRSQAHTRGVWCCAVTVDWHDSNCYLQCGVAGAPEQWKWTFCHRPLYRCQTRVSSVCWVTGTPDLLHHHTS